MLKRILSMDEILGIIKEKHEDALQDHQRLLALFADISRGQMKAQQNQLRIFLECQGNTCILNLRNATKLKQRTEYHRLIQEMVRDYGMRKEIALNISGSFWCAVTCTKPPISVDGPISTEPPWANNVLMRDNPGDIDPYDDAKVENTTVLGSKILRSQIVSITFLNTLAAAPAASWDVSEARDGSVLAWIRETEDLYDLFIAGENGVNGRFCDGLFKFYVSLREIHFNGNFHTDQATSFREMFYFCYSLAALDVNGVNTSMVTDMSCMFQSCQSLKTLNVSGFDTSNVTDMKLMFWFCVSLEVLDVSGFDTSKVRNMRGMFGVCSSLTELKLGVFDTSNVIAFDSFMDDRWLINDRPWEEMFQ